jgi:hypothetical protein
MHAYDVGETIPETGWYLNTSTGQQVWLRKDSVFPPTPKAGQRYRAVIVTAQN